jgi:hypothetical protein
LISEAEAPGNGGKQFGSFRYCSTVGIVEQRRKMSKKFGPQTVKQFAAQHCGEVLTF